jgi:hypothetical protein
MQNTSHAVMSQRIEAKDSPDDFPTPPWATRALLEHVLGDTKAKRKETCLEPACGAGHMAKVLKEYFGQVQCSDAYDYGHGARRDFLSKPYPEGSFDWVITNPPFRLAEEFLITALGVARHGVAILARTVFLESAGRYNAIFRETPPAKFAQFVERVPMVKGRLDKKASTATGYAWFVWDKTACGAVQLVWVPPCRKDLERLSDYDDVAGRRIKAAA